tara:strand:+ start:196 stop:552 length:357 start_codon:yes stop_codon:yes gene_type:complete
MTLIKSKPSLVDYDLIKFPTKKKITPTKIEFKNIFSVNLLMILILCIGIVVLYYRRQNKEKEELELKANILFLDQYITDNLNKQKEEKETTETTETNKTNETKETYNFNENNTNENKN